MARKPLGDTVAANVLEHGTGALNIDGCRVGGMASPSVQRRQGGAPKMSASMYRDAAHNHDEKRYEESRPGELLGRWPANLIHDGSPEVLAVFPSSTSTGGLTPGIGAASGRTYQGGWGLELSSSAGGYGDTGSAARFFYIPKASSEDREDNHHPTVKPTDLMRYLLRLVTPPGGVALDPYMGSGSTGKAAVLEGFGFIGIEREAEYIAIARARIDAASRQGLLL